MAEKRTFSMHPQLLFDVIRRQAGTLAKAVLEAAMNAVDAGAKTCRIELSPERVIVTDDGRGFRNKAEVTSFFEVFGLPHEENEQKVFGTFRMGRGQLFAFGRNHWRTGKFAMDVDIKDKGLDYELRSNEKHQKGCQITIELYNRPLPSDLHDTARWLARWLRWCPIAVIVVVNGENEQRISLDPEEFEWEQEIEEAYIGLNDSQQLSVYNLGVHVKDFAKYVFGCGGEIVSRQPLKVNFARNDIQSDCPVWKKIKAVVDRNGTDRIRKSKSLDEAQRQRLIEKILLGELKADTTLNEQKLLMAVTGRCYRLREIVRHCDGRNRFAFTSAPKGNRIGDDLHRRKMAFVFADQTVQAFGKETLPQLLAYLQSVSGYAVCKHYVAFEELSKDLDTVYTLLGTGDLKPNERLWLALLNQLKSHLRLGDETAQQAERGCSSRGIHVGEGPADGWTDGKIYVAVSRQFLSSCPLGLDGLLKLGPLMLHEFCHRDSDTEDHDHDQAFYELYHDSSETFLGEFIRHGLPLLARLMSQHSRRLTKKQLREQDSLERCQRAATSFEATAARS